MGEQFLPYPTLTRETFDDIPVLTDNALADSAGVRVVFPEREGGVSSVPYESLNLGSHVSDDPGAVAENRRRLMAALGAADRELLVPNQVHGTNVVMAKGGSLAEDGPVRKALSAGADAVVLDDDRAAVLLCFADCAPVVLATPDGMVAVAHAGWRGAAGRIASAALDRLVKASGCEPSKVNAYIGPHIGPCCFEVGDEVRRVFAEEFGMSCVPDPHHVDLGAAVRSDLVGAGVDPDRICDAGLCTVHEVNRYYSYRAEGGTCGRHGALAFRMRGEIHGYWREIREGER